MEAVLSYAAASAVEVDSADALLRLMPNLRRDPTHLRARLADPLAFRDALLALGDCAASELFVDAEEIERRQMDPVVTVTARPVFFEAFSLDESTYGRVILRQQTLADLEPRVGGATNVDFSRGLRTGLEGMRSRSMATLQVSRGGIEVTSEAGRARELKVDLPDSWTQGFMEVQAAMRRPAVMMALHPADLRNLLGYLRKRKETVSPCSLRFTLRPGHPPAVVVEPWNEQMIFRQSRHEAAEEREIRIWGRRRLLLFERVLPAARQVDVRLQGTGLPSFWTAHLGDVSFTLGLSPWTERDWTSGGTLDVSSFIDLTDAELDRAAAWLAGRDQIFGEELAAALGRPLEAATALLDALCRRGRALYDPDTDLFFPRRLFEVDPPLPAALTEREHAADRLAASAGVELGAATMAGGQRTLAARVRASGRRKAYDVTCVVDAAGQIVAGACACPFFARFGSSRGPCKHLLATRVAARTPRPV